MKKAVVLVLLAAVACSSSPSKPAAPAPVVNPTPTPGPLTRTDPTVVEETETYVIRALPKSEYQKVGDRSIKHPLLTKPMEYFKEDDKYYYVYFPKSLPEEKEAAAGGKPAAVPTPFSPGMAVSAKDISPGVSMADFTDLTPPRAPGKIRLERVAKPGLPDDGMWRASFVIADVNGDHIPDIVAPPNRVGNGQLRIWIGDGHGSFSPWPLTFVQDGKPLAQFSIDYGAVAVGDIDGDGKMDVVTASHGAGLVSLFGDGKGTFRVVRAGLPLRDFSSQAITLVDVDGDGKLDIVASRDVPNPEKIGTIDKLQVRVYLYRGDQGWEWKKDGIVGGLYSNSLHAWDDLGNGHPDILTGSNYAGGLTLLWRNAGHGVFEPVQFDALELYALHPTTQPGTFGAARLPAFADSYYAQANVPSPTRAAGITIYAWNHGQWERHRVWREHESKGSVTALAFGDLDGDGLDDIVFADNVHRKLRILFQQPDGSFVEMSEAAEPSIESVGQWICLADLDGDGRLDIVLSRTVSSSAPNETGGFNVYLNRAR